MSPDTTLASVVLYAVSIGRCSPAEQMAHIDALAARARAKRWPTRETVQAWSDANARLMRVREGV